MAATLQFSHHTDAAITHKAVTCQSESNYSFDDDESVPGLSPSPSCLSLSSSLDTYEDGDVTAEPESPSTPVAAKNALGLDIGHAFTAYNSSYSDMCNAMAAMPAMWAVDQCEVYSPPNTAQVNYGYSYDLQPPSSSLFADPDAQYSGFSQPRTIPTPYSTPYSAPYDYTSVWDLPSAHDQYTADTVEDDEEDVDDAEHLQRLQQKRAARALRIVEKTSFDLAQLSPASSRASFVDDDNVFTDEFENGFVHLRRAPLSGEHLERRRFRQTFIINETTQDCQTPNSDKALSVCEKVSAGIEVPLREYIFVSALAIRWQRRQRERAALKSMLQSTISSSSFRGSQ